MRRRIAGRPAGNRLRSGLLAALLLPALVACGGAPDTAVPPRPPATATAAPTPALAPSTRPIATPTAPLTADTATAGPVPPTTAPDSPIPAPQPPSATPVPEPPTVTPAPPSATAAPPAPALQTSVPETPAPAVTEGILVVLNLELAVVSPDGARVQHLGIHGDLHTPRWSPDGGHIAYIQGAGGAADLWVVDAGGTGAHALTHTPGVQEEDPRWAPDGRTLAYTRAADTNGDGRYDAADLREVWLAGLDGTPPHRLADGMDVAWAPDGLRLAFATNGQRAGTPYGANNTIDMINAQGRNRWSPLKIPNIPQDTSLVDPQAPFNAATVFLRYPAWAPGNHTVAFIADGHSGLVVTATDKGANPTLRDFAYEGGMGPVAWSPDGRSLLYQLLPASGIHEVGVLTLANHVKQIFGSAHDGTEADSAVWAPDGAHIAYIQNGVRPSSGASPAGALVVASVNAPGQPLPILPAGAADPDWH